MSLFDLFIYFFVIANFFFQIDRLEPSFTDSVSVYVSVIPIPDSAFRIPCFSAAVAKPHCSLDQPKQSGQFGFSIKFCHPTGILMPKKQRAFPSHTGIEHKNNERGVTKIRTWHNSLLQTQTDSTM